jgi:hypothetical protein
VIPQAPKAALRFQERTRQPPERLFRILAPPADASCFTPDVSEWILHRIRRKKARIQGRGHIQPMRPNHVAACVETPAGAGTPA